MSVEKLDLRRYQEFQNLYHKSMQITSKQVLEIKDPIIRQDAENLLNETINLLVKLENDTKRLQGNAMKGGF